MFGLVWNSVIAILVTCLVLCSAHGHQHVDSTHENRFHDSAVVQDAEHIKEHLKEEINVDRKNMTAEELEFHYFKLHDTDNNTKLDGLEILQAIVHMTPEEDIVSELTTEEMAGKSPDEIRNLEDERRTKLLDYYAGFIDRVMEDDDFDKDGYLTYTEYVLARRRDEQRSNDSKQEKKTDVTNDKEKIVTNSNLD